MLLENLDIFSGELSDRVIYSSFAALCKYFLNDVKFLYLVGPQVQHALGPSISAQI